MSETSNKQDTRTVHILREGHALCGTISFPPSTWPDGHYWISTSHYLIHPNEIEEKDRCLECFKKALDL